MKKAPILLLFLIGFITNSFAQNTEKEHYFIGKWEISVSDSPMGNVKFASKIERKDGKIFATLENLMDINAGARKVTKVEANENQLIIYFESSQGGEIPISLTKVDQESMKGTLLTYEAVAVRVR